MKRVGTLFVATGRRPGAGSSGCATPAARGAGCCSTRARSARSRERHAPSLLAAGITGLSGEFLADDPVEIVGPTVGRRGGLVAYDAREMPALLGRKTGDLAPEHRREVVLRRDGAGRATGRR